MKNKSLFIIIGLVALAVAALFVWLAFFCNSDWCLVTQWQRLRATANFEDCARRGFIVTLSNPMQCRAGGKLFVQGQEHTQSSVPNIKVSAPRPNDEVGLPLIIFGEARVFENQFSYRLRDDSGRILVEGIGTASSPDVGQSGPFAISSSYPEPTGARGTVEVFVHSAADGSEQDMVKIPIRFKKIESAFVKAFFPSSNQDINHIDCQTVYPVERRVAKTSAPATAAINELLSGTSVADIDRGYFTTLNAGTALNRLVINDGTAYVDFNSILGQDVSGACRVTAIRAQITQTLRQFETVKNVVISIEGQTQGILQP